MSQHVNEKSFVSYLCTHCTMTDGLFLSPEFVLLMCVTCRLPYGFTGCRVSSTLRCQLNEQGQINEQGRFLLQTFICLCVCFFLHVSLVHNKRVYSFIWHPRVLKYVHIIVQFTYLSLLHSKFEWSEKAAVQKHKKVDR